MINQILKGQLLIAFGASAAAVIFGWAAAFSVMAGALVSLVANWYFARKMTATAEAIVVRIYIAEILKVVLAATLLAVALSLFDGIIGIALIIGFLLVHLSAAVLGFVPGRLRNDGI